VCSWESSQLPNLADRVRLLALVLDADVARLRKAPVLAVLLFLGSLMLVQIQSSALFQVGSRKEEVGNLR
jgi:hypothetical protein